MFGAIGLIGLAILTGAAFGKPNMATAIIGGSGIVLLCVGFPCTLVHFVVAAINRPQFLVPPKFRDQRGWLFRR
jgi:hypothetical protein